MRVKGAIATAGLALLASGCGETRHGTGALVPAPPMPGEGAGGMVGSAGAGAGGEATASAPRLQAWQLEAEGAEPLVMGIFDTQEQVPCEFLLDSEGQLRCLPKRLPSVQLWEAGDEHEDASCVYFGEPAVLQGFRERPVSLPLPLHGCEQRYVVATINLSDADEDSAVSYGVACSGGLDAFSGPKRKTVSIASVLAPERWVAGASAEGPRVSSRLHLRRMVGADGSTFDDTMVDDRWGTNCTLFEGGDTPGHCNPQSVSVPLDFSDSRCTARLWRVKACSLEQYIGALDGTPLLTFGESYQGQVYAIHGEGARGCVPEVVTSSRAGTDVLYRDGEPIEDASRATFTYRLAGTGRLQRRVLETDDGGYVSTANWVFMEPPRWHDSALNADCYMVRAPEGEMRCVSTKVLEDPTYLNSAVNGVYADAQCSRQAYFCVSEEICDSGLAVLRDFDESGNRQATALVHTTRVASGYSKGQSGCAPLPGSRLLVELGELASWDDFPAFSERNRPTTSAP